MKAGDLVAGRYALEHPVGQGGMGVVWRATDRRTGEPVAVKAMLAGAEDARFEAEVRILRGVSHPAIVRHVDDGSTDEAEPYLVMEWLDGVNLAQRLAARPLSVAESVELVRIAAEGVAEAHRQGIVHRDIKPSNLFLVGGEPSRVRVLDFGIARLAHGAARLTSTRAIVGSVGYMSPEQASGERSVDPRADVFSLGCVLYETLTGVPPFTGAHPLAVLAKVLVADGLRPRERRPEIPAVLDELVERMLARDPARRPRDAGEVARCLAAMELGASADATPSAVASPPITDHELRVASVLMVDPESGQRLSLTPSDATTIELPPPITAQREALSAVARQFGAALHPLDDGTCVVTLQGEGVASDRAGVAASLALAVSAALPGATVVLSTGRSHATGVGLLGPVIDGASALLREGRPAAGVRVDELTAALLDPSFSLERDARGAVLVGRGDDTGPRRLLGHATPCVGREKELGLLDATLAEALDEESLRAVVVTAPAGTGKTRLAREFVGRHRHRDEVECVTVRADPVATGSPLSFVRLVLRAALGATGVEAVARLREELADVDDGDTLSEVLSDLLGAAPADVSATMASVRADPSLQHDWVLRAADAFIAQRCRRRPLVLVLEDLHWADPASAAMLTELLRRGARRPWMVLGLSRPDGERVTSPIAALEGAQEITLAGLSRRAAERVVRAALGASVSAQVVERVVARAGGNAFFLEELVRHVAGAKGESLPETVLAMVESRLDALDPGARRVLRAASVYGESFRRDGVEALLGERGGDVEGWLRHLVAEEFVEPTRAAGTGAAPRWTFRHGLVRDAAYATLTADDRSAAHRAAALWLEEQTGPEPLVVAEHWERGGDAARGLPWIVRAIDEGMSAGSVEYLLTLCARALALSPPPEVAVHVSGCELMLYSFNQGWESMGGPIGRILADARPGSSEWWLASAFSWFFDLSMGLVGAGVPPIVETMVDPATDLMPDGPSVAASVCFLGVFSGLMLTGQIEWAGRVRDRFDATRDAWATLPLGYTLTQRAMEAFWFGHGAQYDPARAVRAAEETVAAAQALGDARARTMGLGFLAGNLMGLGYHERAIEEGRRGLREGQACGNDDNAQWGQIAWALGEWHLGRPDAALRELDAVIARTRDPGINAWTHGLKARVHESEGRPAEARAAAEAALAAPTAVVCGRAEALNALSALALAEGDPARALTLAEEASRFAERLAYPGECWRSALLRCDALKALGRDEESEAVLRAAASTVETVADRMKDYPEDRAHWLTHGPGVAALMARVS